MIGVLAMVFCQKFIKLNTLIGFNWDLLVFRTILIGTSSLSVIMKFTGFFLNFIGVLPFLLPEIDFYSILIIGFDSMVDTLSCVVGLNVSRLTC